MCLTPIILMRTVVELVPRFEQDRVMDIGQKTSRETDITRLVFCLNMYMWYTFCKGFVFGLLTSLFAHQLATNKPYTTRQTSTIARHTQHALHHLHCSFCPYAWLPSHQQQSQDILRLNASKLRLT